MWQLAVVEIEGKRYYDNARLGEYRNVENYMDAILYSELGNRAVKVIQEMTDITAHPEKEYLIKPENSIAGKKRNRKPKL